jgi:hypothetical protein
MNWCLSLDAGIAAVSHSGWHEIVELNGIPGLGSETPGRLIQ